MDAIHDVGVTWKIKICIRTKTKFNLISNQNYDLKNARIKGNFNQIFRYQNHNFTIIIMIY